MKRILKKILVCILICLIINNFLISNISFAGNGLIGDFIAFAFGSVVGILTWPIRIFALVAGMAIDVLMSQVAYSQGTIDAYGNIVPDPLFGNIRVTPFDILFNKIAIININFFNIPDDGTIISNMRMAIASWYTVMRNIASAILLCVFIYVGIRMAISTVASDKAVYKKMLVDWVCSLALIYLLQYIIIFTFSVNEVLVNALSSVADQGELTDAISTIAIKSFGASIDGISATLVYCMLIAQTIGLFISYFNRMLKIAFLIIIAPLITLTYSIDKMGDGKAQALGTWLKEFVYTVLIQPFHCIIYLAFINMAIEILRADPNNSLVGGVLAILCIKFTKDAEKILGKIFRFGDHTSDSSIAVGMAASAVALSKAKSIGKGTRTFVNGLKNGKGTLNNVMRKAKIDMKAGKEFLKGGVSLAEAKEKAEEAVVKKEADKIEEKNAKKYGVQNAKTYTEAEEAEFAGARESTVNKWKTSDKDEDKDKYKKYQNYQYHKRIEAATAANKSMGMSDKVAEAHARAQIAKETKAEKKDEAFRKKHKVISGAKGAINRAKQFSRNSETLQLLGDLAKKSASAGFGTFTGGALYGSGKDMFTSFAAGTAVYKSSNEFFKNSTSTLANNVSQLLEGAGIKSTTEASTKINTIMARGDEFEDVKKYIDDLFKDIDSALSNLSSQDKNSLKATIRNSVQKEIAKNPNASTSDIMNNVFKKDRIKTLMKDGGIDRGKIEGTVRKATDFCRDASIYNVIKQSGDIGLSPDVFIESSIETFRGDLYGNMANRVPYDEYEENTKKVEKIRDGEEILKNGEITAMSKEQLDDLVNKLEEELEATKATGIVAEIKDAYERAYEEAIKREMADITAEKNRNENIRKEEVKELKREVEERMKNAGLTDDEISEFTKSIK